nr:response regulator [Lachnospiraceae bacterium]
SAVDLTLERISSQFDIDFIHILERDSTTTLECFSCIAEFDRFSRLGCPFIGRKFNVDKDDFDKARELLEKDNVIRVDEHFFELVKGDTGDFLNAFGTSGLICFIRSEDEIRGCIFYEKSDRYFEWPQELIDALSELSSIIASFILKNMADQASAAKSNFLSSMSHEIRTPMNAIAGFSELILSEKNISEKTKNYAGNIRSSANNLLGIINQILDFSKIESGKFEIIEDNYAMSSLLNDITSIIGIQISEKPIKFTVNIGKHIPEGLYGDVMRIRQIFINILNNSVKYTDKGEIELSVDWRPKNVETGELIASVRDTGIGIKDEDMPKLFESFMQIDTRRNRGITGTGLGLAVCKNLLNLMGGSIEVQSVYGGGSTFSFTIPQKIVDNTDCNYVFGEIKTRNDEFSLPFVCPDCRILVVDDNRVNLEVAKGLISQYGAFVTLASSGGEAIARVEEDEAYDIIFMDHMMPGMDGIETTVKIREKHDTPIIALTANAIKGVEEEFLNAGMNDYLSKPIELKRLMEVMEKWVPEDKKNRSLEEISAVSDKVNGEENENTADLEENRAWLSKLGHVNVDAGLENSLKDIGMYKSLLSSFIMSNKPETFKKQLEEHDLGAYQISVHSLKSSARYIGAEELSDLAKHFENLVRDRKEEEILENKAGLEELLDTVLKEINEALTEAEGGENEVNSDGNAEEPASAEEMKERLERIKTLLADMETDDAEEALDDFTKLSGVPAEIMKEVKNALRLVRDFDYDEAADNIENVLKDM